MYIAVDRRVGSHPNPGVFETGAGKRDRCGDIGVFRIVRGGRTRGSLVEDRLFGKSAQIQQCLRRRSAPGLRRLA